MIAEIVYRKSSHFCSFILKNTSGSQIHLSSEETPDCSNGSTPISHLSGFVDVSELVSNGGLLVVSAAVHQILLAG